MRHTQERPLCQSCAAVLHYPCYPALVISLLAAEVAMIELRLPACYSIFIIQCLYRGVCRNMVLSDVIGFNALRALWPVKIWPTIFRHPSVPSYANVDLITGHYVNWRPYSEAKDALI